MDKYFLLFKNDNLDQFCKFVGDVDLLKQSKDGCNCSILSPLMSASFFGSMKILKYIVEKCGADVDGQDKNGCTSLMIASKNGQENVVKYLIEKCNANMNKEDVYGKTALIFALENNRDNIAYYLMQQK